MSFERPEQGNSPEERDSLESVSSAAIERDRMAKIQQERHGGEMPESEVLKELKTRLEGEKRGLEELAEKEEVLSESRDYSEEARKNLKRLYARDREKAEAEIARLEQAIGDIESGK